MKKRFLISILLAFLILFMIQIDIQESIIQRYVYCDASWKSFSDTCQSIFSNTETINKAISSIVANDVTQDVKKLLYADYGFMICAYPLLYLLLMQLTTLYDKITQDKLILCIKILAYCQFFSFIADVTENIILHQSLEKNELLVSNIVVRTIEFIKWGFSSIGVMTFSIATVIWAIGFVRETEKASADVNY